MNRRRALLTLLSACVSPFAHAQLGQARRIGILSLEATPAERLLRAALLRLGYKERGNAAFHWQFAEMRSEKLAQLAKELVQRQVEVIVTVSDEATVAAMRATSTIPIVMLGGSIPVELGFIKSLARPGGNVTGTTSAAPETVGKMLATLKEGAPTASKVAVLWDPSMSGVRIYSAESARTAKALGLSLKYFDVTSLDEINSTLGRIAASHPDALYVAVDSGLFPRLGDVAKFAVEHKLPSIGLRHFFVDAGGLLYYGPSFQQIVERTASHVDRILQGANPGDLPVEQPTNFELVINLSTAKAIGMTISQSLQLRADRLIE